MKSLLLLISILFTGAASAAGPVLPTGHSPNSEIWIDYSDLNFVLETAVLDMGPSTHERAGRVKRNSMSRMYGGSRTASRFEGNRVAFHLFKDGHRAVLRAIRDDLLAVPTQVHMSELSRNEQLAYFLNLHNSIVLVKMAEEYPVTRLEGFFDRNAPDAFIVSKQFSWGDTKISLADIQDHILENWQDPLVIYGFYFGAVGTPNIREEAFSGRLIYDQLRANARDFVNSVRGTQVWGGNKLRIANYYQRMSAQFPDFETDVLRHIKQYARDDFAMKLATVEGVEPRIDDWNIADLYNGKMHAAGQTYARLSVEAGGALIGPVNLPVHVQQTLKGRALNFKRFDGTVEIEELGPAGETEEDDQENPDQ